VKVKVKVNQYLYRPGQTNMYIYVYITYIRNVIRKLAYSVHLSNFKFPIYFSVKQMAQ
jgi:hypothetical protein